MSNETQAIDPGKVDWAAVKRGEIEAPQRIVMLARSPGGRYRSRDVTVARMLKNGNWVYLNDSNTFESNSDSVAEYDARTGHLLKTKVDKPAAVAWEDVKDWANPPGVVKAPRGFRGSRKWLFAESAPEFGDGWSSTGGNRDLEYYVPICVRDESFAAYRRIENTDTFRLVWKRGQERCNSQYGAAHCHGAAGHAGACDLTKPCENPRCESFSCVRHDPPEPAPNPYPPKCMKCDNRLDDYGQCAPCLEPDWHKPWRKPADPTFATELPRGATWERWGL